MATSRSPFHTDLGDPALSELSELSVPASDICPGDYLPPQPALHGTRWQDTGFPVGPHAGDVCAHLPVVSGNVLLFGPAGLLSSIARDTAVLVHRPIGP